VKNQSRVVDWTAAFLFGSNLEKQSCQNGKELPGFYRVIAFRKPDGAKPCIWSRIKMCSVEEDIDKALPMAPV